MPDSPVKIFFTAGLRKEADWIVVSDTAKYAEYTSDTAKYAEYTKEEASIYRGFVIGNTVCGSDAGCRIMVP